MLRIAIILLLIAVLCWPAAAEAADASRVMQIVLLTGGVGLQFAGAQFGHQAHESYDAYLHTARPSEMQQFTDDYDRQHLRSIVASRVGVGLIGLATAWALMDQFKMDRRVQVSLEREALRLAFRWRR